MGHLKRINFALIVLTTTLISCLGNQDNFVKRQVTVDIYKSTIPTRGTINQNIQIQLKAQAVNGCYSNIEIKIKEIDNRHFLLKATGLFQTNGICSDIMVYKDTIITFRPTLTGNYFFQINEKPFEITKDTVEVN